MGTGAGGTGRSRAVVSAGLRADPPRRGRGRGAGAADGEEEGQEQEEEYGGQGELQDSRVVRGLVSAEFGDAHLLVDQLAAGERGLLERLAQVADASGEFGQCLVVQPVDPGIPVDQCLAGQDQQRAAALPGVDAGRYLDPKVLEVPADGGPAALLAGVEAQRLVQRDRDHGPVVQRVLPTAQPRRKVLAAVRARRGHRPRRNHRDQQAEQQGSEQRMSHDDPPLAPIVEPTGGWPKGVD
jgi:hypothetical protein